MTLPRFCGVVVVALLQIPPRDNAPLQAQVGAASVSGRVVVNDQRERPIRHVFLQLTGAGLALARMATTDDDGKFEFDALPGGRFTLTAWKNGFVRDTFGTKRPGVGSGAPIVITDGQHVNVTMRMTPSAVIAGKVNLLGAVPSSFMSVQALRYQIIGGERRLTPAPQSGGGFLDDRGEYRIFGLSPGEYTVTTTSPLSSLALRQVSPAELQWAADQFAGRAAPMVMPPQTLGFAPVYFPGTTDPGAAAFVTLGPGEERDAVDFSLQLVPVAKIDGVIVDPDGRPVQAVQATLTPAIAGPMRPFNSVRVLPDGTFSAAGVVPGHYTLFARGGLRVAPPDPASAPAGVFVATPLPLYGAAELDVNGTDVSNVTVRLQPGSTISGRLVFDGQAPLPADLRLARLSVISPSTPANAGGSGGQALADGTFTIAGVAPGRFRISTATEFPTSSAWVVKSAMLEGRDVLDQFFDVPSGQNISGIVVTYTDRPTLLSGTIIDRLGRPAPEYFIFVFSTDSQHWVTGSRRVSQIRPAQNGAYQISGLPPGEYFVCALTDLEIGLMYDAAFLNSLSGTAIKITLREGEKKVQDLKLLGGN